MNLDLVHFTKADDIRREIDALFAREKEKLSGLLPDVDIQHVGSTAVAGTLSKGDLDINIRVTSEQFPVLIEKLKTIYQIHQPENWTNGFASFKDDFRDLGIQVTVIGTLHDCFVAQRNYFRSHPEAVTDYNQLKRKFEGKNMADYRKEKAKFFEAMDGKLRDRTV
jgi:GrpB-like predicted nucleotidyltransferase (UPF0157 family)